jgi:dihydrofolate reductase
MGTVTAGFSMSLDGFVADSKDGVDEVFKWYVTGNREAEVQTGDATFKMTAEGADYIEAAGKTAGVLVTARRTFDLANAWGGRHPMDVPIVVVTHTVPEEWTDRRDSPFTFVIDGVESAIETAQKIAGSKDVAVGAPSVMQQCVALGLLDEIHIDLAPVVLVDGVRLFDHLGTGPIELELIHASGTTHVTHLTYRVHK